MRHLPSPRGSGRNALARLDADELGIGTIEANLHDVLVWIEMNRHCWMAFPIGRIPEHAGKLSATRHRTSRERTRVAVLKRQRLEPVGIDRATGQVVHDAGELGRRRSERTTLHVPATNLGAGLQVDQLLNVARRVDIPRVAVGSCVVELCHRADVDGCAALDLTDR